MTISAIIHKLWSYELKTSRGTITASGSSSHDTVEVTIDNPSSGYGMSETPGSRATVSMKAEEFATWLAVVSDAVAGK